MSMSDEVRRLSEELARDPGSLVFLRLGDALRRRGQLDVALRVSLRGLERHSLNEDAHDLVARIHADRGEFDRALEAWDAVLRLAPQHLGALKGKGFVLYKQARWQEAERVLLEAAALDGGDATIAAAIAHVRRQAEDASTPPVAAARAALAEEARRLFADALGEGEMTAMLIDAEGLVMAGSYPTADGGDASQEIGAELRGVSDEVQRAMRHLSLGSWTRISFETEAATVAMAPAPDGGLVLLAADPSLPQGFVGRVLDLCGERARAWLGGAAAGATR
jgi:tetratricopeptide (TPR) repeat protein